ncbi:MAG: segregation/condensation protein A [Patescibacteria group bacterium]
MTYAFKVGEFEGPLALLLELIEARKLSISAVSLATIADEYIAYLKRLGTFPKEEVAEFLVVASTLMLIKSRALLPTFELTEEEERDIGDLEMRLKLLSRVRELSKNIQAAWLRRPLFSREAFCGSNFGFIEPKGVNAESLRSAIASLVAAFPKVAELPERTIQKVISIEEKMIELLTRFSSRLQAAFHEVVGSKEKTDIIVGFLAVLELVKQGALLVRQEERFGKIDLTRESGMTTI